MSSSKPQPQSQLKSQLQTTYLPSVDHALASSLAHNIFNAFDVDSSEDREFLASLLTSGLAPPREVRKLWELSLMRGMEEWEMMMDCAISLRGRAIRALSLQHREINQGRSQGRGRDSSGLQSETGDGYDSWLLPFLDMILNGKFSIGETCTVARSFLGKRREGERREVSSSAKGERGGNKRVKKTKAVVGRSVSQFWADDDDTLKTSKREMRTHRGITSHADYSGKAVKRDELVKEDKSVVLPVGFVEVVLRTAETNQDDGETKEKRYSLQEDSGLRDSELREKLVYPDIQIPPCSHASPPLPNELLDAQSGDESIVDALSFDHLPTSNSMDFEKRTYKSPFFSDPSPSPRKPSSKTTTSPSKNKSPSKKSQTSRPPGISSLPTPPLSAASFGLIQEELASDPFRLLIAVTFLIKVRGSMAIPLFRQLMARFPTPEALANADPAEIIDLIRPLGLSVNRCSVIQKYARMWIVSPPCKDKRYGVRNYPGPGDARGVTVGEEFGAEPDDFYCNYSGKQGSQGIGGRDDDGDDTTNTIKIAKEHAIGSAWEIGHLTQGPYALDSWRIFCRDKLLGRAEDWKGKGRHPEFQPEWMRVLPRDKELRACLRWMW